MPWRSLGDSNPCFCREGGTSFTRRAFSRVLDARVACTLRQCFFDALRRERRVAQARPGELGDRVADRRRHQWRGHLPDAGRRVVGRYHLNVHQRHIAHARDQIVVEVRLLDRAVFDRDALHQGEAQPVDNAALALRRHIVRLHRDAAVERAPEVVQRDFAG